MKNFTPLKILVVALLSLLPLMGRALPFEPTTDPLSPTTKWYQIKTGNVYMVAVPYDSEILPSSTPSTADDYLWCFVGTESTGYKILSRSRRLYIDELYVNGLGTESTLNYVEPGSGDSFYIAYKKRSQTLYLIYDSLNDSFYSSDTKSSSYTVTEVNAGTLPPKNSEAPTIDMNTFTDQCVIEAKGYGFITLSVDGSEVANPYTIMRTDVDQQVTATATLLQPACLPHSVSKTFTIPRLKAVHVTGDVTGDGAVDIDDLNEIINILLGKTAQTTDGDLTNDGAVDIDDLNEVINIMLGKNASKFTEYTANGVKFKMIDVAGGTFEIGNEASYSASPVHQVTLSDFSIGETEVTQELWVAVMGSNPSNSQDNLQKPVNQVSWNDCQSFITKLNQMTGKNFRLPTEAEWEFAARGGNKSKGYKYSGSNNIDDVAWYEDNVGPAPVRPHPVGTRAPNELGIYDMSGNVSEWCQDWMTYTYESSEPRTNPTGPAQDPGSHFKITRGGDYVSDAQFCTVWVRSWGTYNASWNQCWGEGLRLALSNPLPEPPVGDPTAQSLTATGYNIPHNGIDNEGNEGYAKLVDGNKSTKWCVENKSGAWETIWVDLKSSVPFKPTSYIMTTGSDTNSFYTRNPKNWKIYGRNSENESWTELAHVTDGTGLGTSSSADYTFQFNGVTKAYQYYRFEVIEIGGADRYNPSYYIFQLAELTLMGVAAQ